HPRPRRTVQPAPRSGISEHRMRAVHARGRRGRRPPGRALVVGAGRDAQRMRTASGRRSDMSTTVHSAAATGTDPWVQLLEPARRPPATAVERHAMAALHDARRMRLDQFVDRLAHALYREEL